MSDRLLNAGEIGRLLAGRGARVEPSGGLRDGATSGPTEADSPILSALAALHRGIVSNLAASLSALSRGSVAVRLLRVEQVLGRRFLDTLENPCCLIVLAPASLGGRQFLEIQSSILFAIINRMLGGGQEPGPAIRRPLTEIETSLVSRIAGECLAELNRGWSDVVDLSLSVERVETNPPRLQITAADNPVAVVGFEVSLDNSRGAIRWCIPFQAIEPVREKLLEHAARQPSPPGHENESAALDELNPSDSRVSLAVRLPESKVKSTDLDELRPGDIITTSQDVEDSWTVVVDGVEKFRAKAGTLGGRKAVRIDGPIVPPAD